MTVWQIWPLCSNTSVFGDTALSRWTLVCLRPTHHHSSQLQLWCELLGQHRVVLSFKLKPRGWSSEGNNLWLHNIFHWLLLFFLPFPFFLSASFAVCQYSQTQFIHATVVYIACLFVHFSKYRMYWPRNSPKQVKGQALMVHFRVAYRCITASSQCVSMLFM